MCEQQTFSNDLHDCLMQKDTSRFWKTWNSKCNNKNKSYLISGVYNPVDIVEKFGQHFADACNSDGTLNAPEKAKFEERFVLYPSHSYLSKFVDIETIDKVVYNMTKGKAAGSDSLPIEHILYAHPAFCVIY